MEENGRETTHWRTNETVGKKSRNKNKKKNIVKLNKKAENSTKWNTKERMGKKFFKKIPKGQENKKMVEKTKTKKGG